MILFEHPSEPTAVEAGANHLIDLGDVVLHIILSEDSKGLARVAVQKKSTTDYFQNLSENTVYYSAPSKITLVPSALANKELEDKIVNHNFSDSKSIRSIKSITQAETLFFEESLFFEELAKKTMGNHSTIVVPLLHELSQQNGGTLLIASCGNTLYIGVFEGERLLFFNGFYVETLDELLYYTMLTVQQYQLDPSAIQVVCVGDIDAQPELREKLLDYFLEVKQVKHELISDMRYSGFVKLITR